MKLCALLSNIRFVNQYNDENLQTKAGVVECTEVSLRTGMFYNSI